MREREYRVWDKHEKVMYIDVQIRIYGDGTFCVAKHGGWYSEDPVEDLILMDYTGLKERDNHKVYEDDVFLDISTATSYRVIFVDGCFVLKSLKDGDVKDILDHEAMYCLGNAHETPELLKETP